ncbi:DUF1566 domain-containing protein [Vibrio coralliilyticus]|uniref:Lcl domain-containing protein n=1 Tax=Vibrio coralliilyticus TaxID=190893 RepID=UPI0006CCA786|nr:DUF1566 domain-containing protein [Vibrio coralliilyticus]AXN34406.1 DUF1566 domain-containing protein [Vibrio coralliilyticus]KPH24066.1 hypothetical protein ADU60_21920 [Vibrio coralliilyticus]
MKYQLSMLATAILLAGCGGSGGSDASSPTYSVSGTVTAQAASGNETVCADLDGDFTCDSGEPSTTASNGAYTITSTNKAILESPLVVELDTGASSLSRSISAQSSGSANAFFVAPAQQKATGNEINAVTTLVASEVAGGANLTDAISSVVSQLTAMGLSADSNILNNGDSNEYATLEQNTLALIAAMDKSEPSVQLSILSANLNDFKDVMLAGAPTDEEITSLLNDLDKASTTKGFNDTGIVTYFTDGGDSADAPADYAGQDADYGLDKTDSGFKFTKLNTTGESVAADATDWSCVKDERTGLIWETKNDDSSSVQYKDRYFAYQVTGKFEPFADDVTAAKCSGDNICTTEQYVAHLNTQKVCGISTWRLPTFGEFYNLIDFGETTKAPDDRVYGLDTTYFPHQSVNSEFAEGEVWTSTEFYTEYENIKTAGSMYIQVAQTRGSTRGVTYGIEIYSDQVAADSGSSWQLPIRLVAETEAK